MRCSICLCVSLLCLVSVLWQRGSYTHTHTVNHSTCFKYRLSDWNLSLSLSLSLSVALFSIQILNAPKVGKQAIHKSLQCEIKIMAEQITMNIKQKHIFKVLRRASLGGTGSRALCPHECRYLAKQTFPSVFEALVHMQTAFNGTKRIHFYKHLPKCRFSNTEETAEGLHRKYSNYENIVIIN